MPCSFLLHIVIVLPHDFQVCEKKNITIMHFKIKIYRNVQLSLLFVQFYMTLGLFLILYIVFSFLWETLLSLNNRNSLSATLDSYKLCADQQQSCVSMKLFAFSPFWIKFLVDNYFLNACTLYESIHEVLAGMTHFPVQVHALFF